MSRFAGLTIALLAPLAFAQRIPINDLGGGKYLGFNGGLYENGSNAMPADHRAAGLVAASKIRPLDANGNPSPNGKIVFLSIGMSNTTQEFCAANNPAPCTAWSFTGQATADAAVNHTTLAIINGARSGQSSDTWDSAAKTNYDLVRTNDLQPAGLTEKQVQAAWVKLANPGPTVSLPSAGADAYTLVTQMGNVLRAMKSHYPNLRIVYFTSRIYAGYATSTLNPEPYAYESGFAVKWLVQAQIDQRRGGAIDSRAGDLDDNRVAWIAWGPYPWADGTNARSDGLTWSRSELESDGTHPATAGEQKIGAMLLAFLKSEPTAMPWFLASPPNTHKRRAVRP